MTFKAAAIQMCSGVDPAKNAETMAAAGPAKRPAKGASYVQTPEMTGALQRDRAAMKAVLRDEDSDLIVEDRVRACGRTRHPPPCRLDGDRACRRQDGQSRLPLRSGRQEDLPLRQDPHVRRRSRQRRKLARECGLFAGRARARLANCRSASSALPSATTCAFPNFSGRRPLPAPKSCRCPPRSPARPARRIGKSCCAPGRSKTACSSSQRPRPAVHEDGRETYGHSMIIDPWGTVLAPAGGTRRRRSSLADIDTLRPSRRRGAKIPNLKNGRTFALREDGAGAAAGGVAA